MNADLVVNSLVIAVAVTALATAFGAAWALAAAAMGGGARRIALAVAALTLVLPPFLAANAWMELAGANGPLRAWLPFPLFSRAGAIWIMALQYWPIPGLLAFRAWAETPRSLLEWDPLLRDGRLIRWALIPQALPSLGCAAVVTAALAFNSFSTPALLQTPTVPSAIWLSFSANFDYAAAFVQSWPLAIGPLLIFAAFARFQKRVVSEGVAAAPTDLRRRLKGIFPIAAAISLGLALLSLAIPLLQLAAAPGTWRELLPAVKAGGGAIWNSLLFATTAAISVALVGALGARRRAFAAAWLAFLLPGVLLGVALIFLFNRSATVALYQSSGIVMIALFLRFLGFGWHNARAAFASAPSAWIDFTRLHRGGRGSALRHALLPATRGRLLLGAYLVYLLALWEMESLILLYPPGGETLAIRIFSFLHYGHNAHINALCLILLGLGAAPLLIGSAVTAALARGKRARSAWAAALCVATAGAGCGRGENPNAAPIDSRFFESAVVIGSRGIGPGQFNKPRSVAVDAEDCLYVVDMTGRVQKFSPEGEFVSFWQMPETARGRPKGMCPDPAGGVVVVEPHYARVNHFALDGVLRSQWGAFGSGPGELGFPRAVAVNPAGEIYVSEYGDQERIQKFAPGGASLLLGWGEAGNEAGQFNRPEGLAIDGRQRVYVADSCNHRIQVFTSDGAFLSAYGQAGRGSGELSYPYDIQVDRQGRQFVCEFGNSRIQVFDADGRPVESIGGPGARPGWFSNPWGLAFDSQFNLYVADSQNHRVQKLVARPDAFALNSDSARTEKETDES